MLSLFIMFSNDRVDQLQTTLACLQRMKHYDRCQKTLVVDGAPEVLATGFQTVSVPRFGGKFCWANMWAAGVCTARHNTILYLDSDRLLPSKYLEMVLDTVEDDVFAFTSSHYMLRSNLSVDDCVGFLEDPRSGIYMEEPYLGSLLYEPRHEQPFHGPGKNVMSGNTAFTKNTYFRLKGVDPWYCGHGAFADTDFHMTAAQGGCRFLDLRVPELHCGHVKMDDQDIEVESKRLYLLGLDNFIYYCRKWGLPLSLAEYLAFDSGVMEARKYVRSRLEALICEAPRDLAE